MHPTSGSLPTEVDVAVVGAGVVGLAHAAEAADRGLRVAVVERDARPVGASVRNFGHACVTAQVGVALERATYARQRWLELAERAGFWTAQTGTLVVARADDELAVLEEFADTRPVGDVVLLDADGVREHLATAPTEVVGGAWLPKDLRVNPREAVSSLATWLGERDGVTISFGTNAMGVEAGALHTTAGSIAAERIVVCVNHDVDRLLPEVARAASVRRCWLQMLRVAVPAGVRIGPGVLSGTSLLRYGGFAACPSLEAVRRRLAEEHPALLAADVNLMCTQLPDGDLLLGDTHDRGPTVAPFSRADWDDLLLAEGARLLGLDDLRVIERWQGVYATAPEEFLVAEPLPGVSVVSVTTGIGMTCGFGLAREVVDGW
ncbi:MAG: TIGR03364 family FAD-dependent oxidoreductase [Acidimicrobiia bacterium]|nr:TIGR03364 family FAD-dependent oxidoreductase [Acidimicrobiia bacterium]